MELLQCAAEGVSQSNNSVNGQLLRLRYRECLKLANFGRRRDFSLIPAADPYQGMAAGITIERLWGGPPQSMFWPRAALPIGTRWSCPPGRRCHVYPFAAA